MRTELPLCEAMDHPASTPRSGSALLACGEEAMDPLSGTAEGPMDLGQLVGRCMGNLQIVERALAKFESCFGRDLAELEQRLQQQEVEQVRRLAHRLKGSAAAVAAGKLAQRSAEIEELVRSQRMAELPACVEELRQEWLRFLSFRGGQERGRPAADSRAPICRDG